MDSTAFPNLTIDVTASEGERDQLDWFAVFSYVLLAVDIVLILALNSLGLYILRRFSKVQETTKMFMTSLTLADINIGVFCALPHLIETVTGAWALGDFPCLLWGIVYPALLQLSVFSLTLLSVDRFVAIVYSLRYNDLITPRRSKVAVALLWTLTLAENIVLYGIITRCTATADTDFICDYTVVGVYQYTSMSFLVISQALILLMYLYILHVASSQARRIAAQDSIGGCSADAARPPRVSAKSATTVVIITGSVFLCWTPGVILIVLRTNAVYFHYSWSTVAKAAFYSNSWINVVIYYLRNGELRRTLHRWVASKFCGRNPNT